MTRSKKIRKLLVGIALLIIVSTGDAGRGRIFHQNQARAIAASTR